MKLLVNGNIHTNQPGARPVSALAIDHGMIIATGTDQEMLSRFGKNIEITDLGGKTVWPGLIDSHIHLEHYALSLAVVDCETPTRAECLRRVSERVQQTAPGVWVRGHGWNQNVWPEGFGSIKELDEIAPHHPVYLTAKSLHAGWANSAALRLAGIQAETPDPEGGKFVRDEMGKPTGILLESAMQVIEDIIPSVDVNQLSANIQAAQKTLWSLGITGVHDFDRARCFSALQILDQSGRLKLRVVKSIPSDLLDQATELGLRSGFGSAFLRIGSVKLFADGALGPHTAAMLQPYEEDPGNTGILFIDSEEIYEVGQKAASGGFSMAIHAIGDRANHEVLNAYEQLRTFETQNRLSPLRHRIEHVQCLHPQDYERLSHLNVIASVQPIHATSDMLIADAFWGQRAAGAYAYQTLLQAGTHLTFGSDAPVESPNPWWGLHAAVTRRRMDGTPKPEGWYPEQRLSLQDALNGFTSGPAYAAGLENVQGQLIPGFYADLIVLEQDPFTIPAQDLHQMKPLATMVAGDWAWQRE